MEDRSMMKMLFMGSPGGKRRKGRDTKRWLDDVQNGFRYMAVRTWRAKSSVREV
jgi:hypothetical protein